MSGDPEKLIDMVYAAADFYALEYLASEVKLRTKRTEEEHDAELNQDRGSVRRDVDAAEITGTYAQYAGQLALAMRDYLALAAYGESRHAPGSCKAYLHWTGTGGGRGEAMNRARAYNPERFLPALSGLFNKHRWGSSFGGKAWGNIVDAAMMYGQYPDALFIDHSIDLTHNGGPAWNKTSANIVTLSNPGTYLAFLDAKAGKTPGKTLLSYWHYFSGHVKALYRMAHDRGWIDENPNDLEDLKLETMHAPHAGRAHRLVMSYIGVEWGNGPNVPDFELFWYRKSSDYDDTTIVPKGESWGYKKVGVKKGIPITPPAVPTIIDKSDDLRFRSVVGRDGKCPHCGHRHTETHCPNCHGMKYGYCAHCPYPNPPCKDCPYIVKCEYGNKRLANHAKSTGQYGPADQRWKCEDYGDCSGLTCDNCPIWQHNHSDYS